MAKKVSHEDIIAGSLFGKTIDEAKVLIEHLDKIRGNFKDMLNNSKKIAKSNQLASYADIEQIAKGYDEAKQAADAYAKSERDLAKANKLLADAQKGEIDLLYQNKLAIQAANAETKRLAKETIYLGSVYDQESAKLNNLRRKYKDLAVQNKENTKEGKALLKQVQDLDAKLKGIDATVGQHQRNVGNYQSALEALPGAFGNAANGAKELGAQFLKLLKNPVVLIIAGIVFALKQLFDAFTSTDEGGTAFAALMEQVSAIMDVVRQRFAAFANGIVNFFKGNWKQAAADFSESFTGIGDQIEQATKAAKEYTYALDELEDAEIGYISRRAQDANKIAKLEFEAADRSKSIAERRKALQEAIRLSEEETKKEGEFARKKFDIELEYQAKLKNISKEALKEFIEADDIRQAELLKNNKELARVRNLLNDEGQKKLEENYAAMINADTKFFEENKRNIGRLSGLKEEEAEKEKKRLDDLYKHQLEIERLRIELMEDGLAKQLALENLRYIQEQHDLKGNFQALELARQVHNKNVEKLIKANADARIAAEKKVHDLIFQSNATEFEKQQQQIIEQADQREKELADLLEKELISYKDYNDGIEAIGKQRAEAEKKLLNDTAKAEREKRIDSIHQEEQLQEALLEQKRSQFKSEKEWEIYKQKELIKIKRAAIEAELRELQYVQTKEAELRREQLKAQLADLQAESDKILQEAKKKSAQQLEQIAAFEDKIEQDREKKRLARIDGDLAANKKRQDELRQLAIQGNKTAQDSLAEEEKRQAQLELKRERELEKQKRRELKLAAIQTYSARVQAGDPNPVGSTIKDLTLLATAVGAIPGFIEGVERVKDAFGAPNLSVAGPDNYVARFNGDERILNPKQNAMVGDMTNNELASLAYNSRKGLLVNMSGRVPAFTSTVNTESVNQLKAVREELAEIKENTAKKSFQRFDYVPVRKALIETIKEGNKTEKNIYKAGGLW